MPTWKRNLIVLCGTQLLTMIGFSMYLPFMAYYVQELGVASYQEAMSWVAIFDSGASTAMMLSSPIWGALADRFGRKPMLIRATLAAAIVAFAMGMTKAPAQLMAIRILQGIFCGTVAAAVTIVATGTPEENLGMSLGMMQTVQFVGHAVGPLIGGVLADALGYRQVFPIAAGLMTVSLVSVAVLVRETIVQRPVKKDPQAAKLPFRERVAQLMSKSTVVLLVCMAMNSFAIAVLGPIVSLYVKTLTDDHTRIATLAGAVVSASAFTSSFAALGIGRLGDRLGQKKVLICCAIGAALIHVPQAYVTNAIQLLVLRAIQGVFIGGIIPTANALLAHSTEASRRGTVFGFSTGIQAGGRAIAPIAGAAVASSFGMSRVFLMTAGLFGVITVLVGSMVRVPARSYDLPEGEALAPESKESGAVVTGTPGVTSSGS
ncbi:MAG TPA: multidrug efflux MFS transporter [Chloroflexi bacterium]|jgi:DHA1 family multidrug resistance protein-like MFS transporter|nr:multidrug efflux MFS transporter [Chloroflexota bacterium]